MSYANLVFIQCCFYKRQFESDIWRNMEFFQILSVYLNGLSDLLSPKGDREVGGVITSFGIFSMYQALQIIKNTTPTFLEFVF